MPTHKNFSRRDLMNGLGLSAGSLFLPSLLDKRIARAATPPRRIILVMSMFGHTPTDYNLRPGAVDLQRPWKADLATLPEAEWSRILRPLYPFRRKLVALEGLDMVSAKYETRHYPDVYHQGGIVNLVTGQFSKAADVPVDQRGGLRDKARGISIDQFIASKIKDPPRWKSLEVATGRALGGSGSYSFSASGGSGLPAERDPKRLFDRLFPAGVGEAPPAGNDARPGIAERIARQRKSVLDLSRTEYEAFSRRSDLSSEDRRKLELYRDFVRDIEAKLQIVPAAMSAGCGRPDAPGAFTSGADYKNGAAFDRHVDAMSRLIAAAVACDQVRVVNMVLHGMPSDAFAVGGSTDDVHFKWAHNDRIRNGQPTDANAYAQMGRYHIHHADKHIATLAKALDSIPEGNGTVLDNTLLVWWNEMARGAHTGEDYGAVLLGGGNLGIDTGKYMYFPTTPVKPFKSYTGTNHETIGLPHHHLLVSFAHAMGLTDVSSFGRDEIEGTRLSGPVPGLHR